MRILDFGLARTQGEEGHLTRSGAVIGTAAYMAPEQARGKHVDHRADLFSLGVVLYQMATGQRPFTGSDTMSILTSLALDTPEAPCALNAAVPEALSDLIMRLLAKDAAKRPASADAVLNELNRIAQEMTIPIAMPAVLSLEDKAADPWASIDNSAIDDSKPVALPEFMPKVAKPKKRRGLLIVAGFAAFALLAAGTIVIVNRNKDGKPKEDSPKFVEIQPPPPPPVDDFLKPENWEGKKEVWKIDGSAIVGEGKADLGFTTFFCTKKKYKDFEMSFQVRLKNGIGNSGVQFRSKLIDRTRFDVAGPQADIGKDGDETVWGSLFGTRFTKDGTIGDGHPMKKVDSERLNIKPADFNDYSIKVVAKKVTVTINRVIAIDEEFSNLPEDGIIALEIGGGLEATFKNIKFKELKTAEKQKPTVPFSPLDPKWVQKVKATRLAEHRAHRSVGGTDQTQLRICGH